MPRRKERVNRQEQNKFDPLRLEVKYPGTAILLLQCQEQPVLLAAATALAKFGRKAQGNLEVLFDLAIVDSVMPLIEHEDLFTRRFATMLLAEMTVIPNVRNFLLESSHHIPHFTRVLINDRDIFMQEFSSLILANLSEDMFGAAQLLKQCSNMDFLFERLESPDPDVKRNNIQIIYNLLQDLTGAEAIVETKVQLRRILYLGSRFILMPPTLLSEFRLEPYIQSLRVALPRDSESCAARGGRFSEQKPGRSAARSLPAIERSPGFAKVLRRKTLSCVYL